MKLFLELENRNNGLELSPEFNPLNLSEDKLFQLKMLDFLKGIYLSEDRDNYVPETQEWYVLPEGVIICNKIMNSECNTDTQRLIMKEDLPNWLARKLYL